MWTLDEFEVGQKLGEGGFGRVHLARRGRAVVVLKILRKAQISRHRAERKVERELDIQSHLHHGNILALYAYFWDEHSIYMVLEHSHLGDLRKIVLATKHGGGAGGVGSADAACYLRHTISGLQHLHERDIIFRDLKSENLFLFHGKVVKLGDFGAAVHAPAPDAHRRKTLIGTPVLYPPEMITADTYEKYVDLWALGLLAFELLFAEIPIKADTDDQFRTFRSILQLDAKKAIREQRKSRVNTEKPQEWFTSESDEAADDLIAKLLVQKPEKRLTLDDCAVHPFLKQ
ncbi:unnamed protein product [Amoebophrya sp. A25]|nr:unnamed protein product [Amoebophrya sp. A25]|eukprot:GSA25T00008132001.1